MMLRRLELQAFGRFRDEVVEFAPGMNLVSGPNESGKTTLLQALAAVLFGTPEASRFIPWESPGNCRAALVWAADDRLVRIERDFVTGRVDWSEATSDGDFQPVLSVSPKSGDARGEQRAYLSHLQTLLGVDRKDLFQFQLCGDALEASVEQLSEGLKACFADQEASELADVLKTLQDEYVTIASANPWGLETQEPGALDVIAQHLQTLEKEWFTVHESIRLCCQNNTGSSSENLVDEPANSDQVEPLKASKAFRVAAEEPVEDDAPADKTTAGHGDLVTDNSDECAALEAELAKTGLPREIPHELPDLLNTCAELRQAMAEQKRALGARQEERRRCRMPAWKSSVWGLAGLWTAAGLWYRVQPGFKAIVAGALATGLVGAWQGWRYLQIRKTCRLFDSQIAGLEAAVGELQQQLTALNDRFEALGMSPSPVEMVRMQKNLPRHRQLLEQLQQCATAPAESPEEMAPVVPLVDPVTPVMEEACIGAGQPTAAHEDTSDSFADKGWQPGELDELLDARSGIEAQGEILRAQEAQLKARTATLRVACDLLEKTLAECTGSDLETFAFILGQTLSGLTGGAVEQAHITPQFTVELPGPDGDWLPVEYFSSATGTLVKLALCLSFNQLCCEPVRLPLVLDEPLGNLDRKRRSQVMKFLEQCAAGQQVILLSHEDALRRRATRDGWHLVSLRTAGPLVAASNEEKNDDDGQLSFL